jgi:hypothetical protein
LSVVDLPLTPPDNILITTAVIEMNQYLNKESYSVYTDAEKCFDLLDLNDGVVELWRCGTDVRDCIMIKRLNERARIKVITPVGETDFFELENIVRQGTVYGPQICIAVMDRINFTGDDIVAMYSPDLELRAPTFVDDVTNTGSLRSVHQRVICPSLIYIKRYTRRSIQDLISRIKTYRMVLRSWQKLQQV